MFPQFVSTAASFSRATALLTRVGTDAQLYDDPETENFAVLLDSKYEAEKSEGIKRLIALMSQGRDVSNFFPQVVKNIVTQSLELKKLVYIYLIHYAEKRPDEALLAINTFQKDLSDLNPLVRAWALRAMSGIRVRVVLPLVIMAVNKCARDPSPYVRRCAAHAIPKIYSLDHEQYLDALEELICLLMNDNSPGVIGAVAAAFTFVCPEKLSLWGVRFQQFCELLPNVDEWGQIVLIDILLRYAIGTHGYPEGSIGHLSVQDKMIQDNSKQEKLEGKLQVTAEEINAQVGIKDGHKKRVEMDEASPLTAVSTGFDSRTAADFWLRETPDQRHDKSPDDIERLLQSTLPLLANHNSAVVMAAAGVHWLLASMENVKKIVKPLLFLLRSSFESQYVVLANIAMFVKRAPSLFEAYYEDFFILSADTQQIRDMKLDILGMLATESSIQHIIQEFQAYVRDPDRQFAANAVRTIGQCALRLQTVAKACTEGLLLLARSGSSSPHDSTVEVGKDGHELLRKEKTGRYAVGKLRHKPVERDKGSREALVVTEAVMALQTIIQTRPLENEEVLARLVRGLDRLTIPEARAIVIWMVGEFSTVGTRLPKMVPVILQYLGGTFKTEADEAKLQILNCAAKVVLQSGRSSRPSSRSTLLILDYVLRLAAQDLSYDIRDRGRMYQQLLAFHLQGVSQNSVDPSDIAVDRFLNLHIQEINDGQGSSMEIEPEGNSQNASNVTRPSSHEDWSGAGDKKVILLKLAQCIFLMPKTVPTLPSLAPDRSAFVPGSMSHIVAHRAPSYRPLPIPFSIELAQQVSPLRDPETGEGDANLDSGSSLGYSGSGYEEENSDGTSSLRNSGTSSFYEQENDEHHLSDTPCSNSEGEHFPSTWGGSDRCVSETHASSSHQTGRWTTQGKIPHKDLGPLITLSDPEPAELSETQGCQLEQRTPVGGSLAEFGLLSPAELDSWLGSSGPNNGENLPQTFGGYAAVSVGTTVIEPRIHTLLDFTNGGGLDVKYWFERVVPVVKEDLLSIKFLFENRSLETLADIMVMDDESGSDYHVNGSSSVPNVQIVVSEQKVSELEPGHKVEGRIGVIIPAYHKPIKLSIRCSGKSYPVKLIPDVGALIRPVLLSLDAFSSAESRITGMHEALRRCILMVPSQSAGLSGEDDQILRVARAVSERVLGSAHVAFISTIMPIGNESVLGEQTVKVSGGLQGLCLRFSGETLIGSLLCLIMVTVLTESIIGKDAAQVEVMVKVNCEDTVFGLSLLQELGKALNSSD